MMRFHKPKLKASSINSCSQSQLLYDSYVTRALEYKVGRFRGVFHFLYSKHAFVSSLLLMKINLQSMALYQPQ